MNDVRHGSEQGCDISCTTPTPMQIGLQLFVIP